MVSHRVYNKIKDTSIRQSSFSAVWESPVSDFFLCIWTNSPLHIHQFPHCPLSTLDAHPQGCHSLEHWLLPSIHPNSFISGRTRAPLPRLFILTSRSKGLLEKIRWLGETLKGKINSIWTVESKGQFSLISSKRTFEYVCTFARILKRLPLSLPIHVSEVNHHQGLLQCTAMRSEAWKTHLSWLNCNRGAEFPPDRSPSSCKAPGKHDEEQYYP